MMANDMPPLMRIDIVASSVTVWYFVTDDEVRYLSNTVGDHDRSTLLAFPTGKPAQCGAETRRFLSTPHGEGNIHFSSPACVQNTGCHGFALTGSFPKHCLSSTWWVTQTWRRVTGPAARAAPL